MVRQSTGLGYSRLPPATGCSLSGYPRLCYVAEDREADLYALDGQPKTVNEAIGRMQFYQYFRRSRPSCPSYHTVMSLVVGEESSKGNWKTKMETGVEKPSAAS